MNYQMFKLSLEKAEELEHLLDHQKSKRIPENHLFQNFPQLIVIHTVKGFGIVNKAEIDVFLELSCFFDNQTDMISAKK